MVSATRPEFTLKKLYASLLAGTFSALASLAHARVHVVQSFQTFTYGGNEDFSLPTPVVAIENDSAVAILYRPGGRQAVLFQRVSGQWAQTRVLLDVTTNSSLTPDDVKIADGIAAIRLADVLHVFERTTNWSESATAGTPRPAPGLATSARRILAGRRGCNYDANVYSKSAGSGVWGVSGRASGQAGECNDHGAALDLEGDVALVLNPPGEIREYRRNGTALDWPQVGTIVAPDGVAFSPWFDLTLHGDVAATTFGHWFRRVGGAWNYQGKLMPLNSGWGTGVNQPDYKGELLVSTGAINEQHAAHEPYLFRQNAAGRFDNLAKLATAGDTGSVDLSGSVAIVASQDEFEGTNFIEFFNLPSPLIAPKAIANDFEAGNVSGFQQTVGSQFALATSGSNRVYRQSATTGESHAVLSGSNWSGFQSIEADVTPTAFDGADRWFGVAVRYFDADNRYYLTLRSSGRLQLKRMVKGQFTTLAERILPVSLGTKYRLRLTVDGSRLEGTVIGVGGLDATDTALTRGQAALMTYRTRADFDDVYAAPTRSLPLAWNHPGGFEGSSFTHEGGTWNWVELPSNYPDDVGEAQQSTSGDARAFFGTPTDDQHIETSVRLDSFNASPSGAWFGVLARWVDARNFYYLTLRSNGKLELRKQVNGVITVLRSVPFSAEPGRFYRLGLDVLGDQLHAYVDGAFVAGAVDGDIAEGKYGLGSYRAAFTYQWFDVRQP